MALRGKAWVWDTTTNTAEDSNSIITSSQSETVNIHTTGGSEFNATHTIVTREWVALSKTGAQDAYDCAIANDSTGGNWRLEETNRVLGAYKVVKITDSSSIWS